MLASLENEQADRCVDLFRRPDGSFGFDHFRRDVEDRGAWTPTACFSAARFASLAEARAAAAAEVAWLG